MSNLLHNKPLIAGNGIDASCAIAADQQDTCWCNAQKLIV